MTAAQDKQPIAIVARCRATVPDVVRDCRP